MLTCGRNTHSSHRITECSGLAGTSVGHPVQPPAEAGSPTAGCTGPCPGGAWISPEKETPQPPWAAWARAPSPSEGRSSSSCSAGTSSASVCAHCPLSCCWAPLKRVWPHPPDPHPADIYKQKSPRSLLFSRLNSPSSPSLSSQQRVSSPRIIAGVSSGPSPGLFCAEGSRAGRSAPRGVSPEPGAESPPSPCCPSSWRCGPGNVWLSGLTSNKSSFSYWATLDLTCQYWGVQSKCVNTLEDNLPLSNKNMDCYIQRSLWSKQQDLTSSSCLHFFKHSDVYMSLSALHS